MNQLLYGVAYYDEYMPYDRLAEDIRMLKAANINTVRIAESTWSTWEPQNGVFDFHHLDRVIDAMEEAGIYVIVGTPTYAFPTWLAKEHPEMLAQTKQGQEIYGRRQNMDITNPAYRFYGERVIRKIVERTAHRTCVIGYQLDNETKHYDAANEHIQQLFVKALREEFGTVEALNDAFGLTYWSNRINAWEDFPDVRGTINGSLGAAFSKFQRKLVTEFLHWQEQILRPSLREDQFITHNFDFEWHGFSYGVQPDVDHYEVAKYLDIAGCDIYHPTQDRLTGLEISVGGDLIRSLKGSNYFILETEAQGFPQWTPFDGQLFLQAFSHLASGAEMVEYWHWHSIHNSFETYWRGLVSHDLAENQTYREAQQIGAAFKRLSPQLMGLEKRHKVAILVSNESLTALRWFPIDWAGSNPISYNDVMRWCYDALYSMQIGVDFLYPQSQNFSDYDVIVVPALYSAPEALLQKLNDFAAAGGELVVTFKSGFTNEHVKVYHDAQPHLLTKALGVTYQQFTYPEQVGLTGCDGEVQNWMELLQPTTATVLASYDHHAWGRYAAITENGYGKGYGTYIGCMTDSATLQGVLERVLKRAGVWGDMQDIRRPLVVKESYRNDGGRVRFYLNYSKDSCSVNVPFAATELLSEQAMTIGETIEIKGWGVAILAE